MADLGTRPAPLEWSSVQLRMAGGSNLLHNSNSFVILPLLFASITLVVFGTGTSASPAGYDFLPIEDVYVRPMKVTF